MSKLNWDVREEGVWFAGKKKKEWSRVVSLRRADTTYTSTFRLQCSNRVDCLEILEMGSGNSKFQGPGGRSIPEEQVPVQGLSSRTVTRTGLNNEDEHKHCYDYGCSLTDKFDVTHRSWNSSLCTQQVVEEAGTLPPISEHDLWAIGWDLLGC